MSFDLKDDIERAIAKGNSPIITESKAGLTLLPTPLQDLIKALSNNGYNTISITLNAYKDLDKEEADCNNGDCLRELNKRAGENE